VTGLPLLNDPKGYISQNKITCMVDYKKEEEETVASTPQNIQCFLLFILFSFFYNFHFPSIG
jgi:hypothetical protein